MPENYTPWSVPAERAGLPEDFDDQIENILDQAVADRHGQGEAPALLGIWLEDGILRTTGDSLIPQRMFHKLHDGQTPPQLLAFFAGMAEQVGFPDMMLAANSQLAGLVWVMDAAVVAQRVDAPEEVVKELEAAAAAGTLRDRPEAVSCHTAIAVTAHGTHLVNVCEAAMIPELPDLHRIAVRPGDPDAGMHRLTEGIEESLQKMWKAITRPPSNAA